MGNSRLEYCLNPSFQGFSVSQKSIFGISLNMKKANHSWIFNVRTRSVGGSEDNRLTKNSKFLETQLSFQPTFDEYLKAMESVRTGSEKTHIRHPRKTSTVNGVPRKPKVEGDKESVKSGSEWCSRQEKNVICTEGGDSSENTTSQEGLFGGKLGFKERGNRVLKGKSKLQLRKESPKKGGLRSTHGLGEEKLECRPSVLDFNIEMGAGEANGDGSSKEASSLQLKTRESEFSRNMRVYKNYEKSNAERISANVGKLGESENSKTCMNKFYRSKNERKLVESESNNVMQEKELFCMSKVERKMRGSEIVNNLESERSYGNRKDVRLNGSAFESGKLGHRNNRISIRLDRDHIQTEDTRCKTSLKHGKFTRGNKVFVEDDDENDLDIERAAFRSFEIFTDVRDKPRVLRMEMEERIQNLAKWLNGTDINVPEWLFSKMMHSANIRFTDHSILRVIQILGTLGNWRRALQVIEWLQSHERFKSYKSRYIYTAALDVLGKAKRPVEALNVFHAMRQDLSSYPDLAAYHCIAVTLGQAGYMKELFDVIDCMRSPPPKKFNIGMLEKWDPRLEPDVIVYNSVLNACVRRKQWEGAFWVLEQLKQQGLKPSSTTYGLVMEVMFSCSKYNLVHEFFRKVEKSSIPNSLNYRVLVNTLWRERKTDEAVLAVQNMERRGIVGSASLYYDLARCLCSAGRCQEALMQIDKICKVASKPLVVTYTGLIQSCLEMGSVQNGAYIFKRMHRFCSPNLVTCNIMLKAYLEHKMFEEAKDLFHKMLDNSNVHIKSRDDYEASAIPDNYTFNTMLDACIAQEKWDEFEYTYLQMIHHGYNFNTKRHLRMIMEACRAGKGELIETTWKHLVQAGRVPPMPIVKERFCMKLKEDDYVAAISCITIHQTNKLLHGFSEKVWLDLFQVNANQFRKDTLLRFTHELNNIVAGSDQPHPMLQNLITSCKEFLRVHKTAAEIDPIEEHGRTVVLPQLDAKLQ